MFPVVLVRPRSLFAALAFAALLAAACGTPPAKPPVDAGLADDDAGAPDVDAGGSTAADGGGDDAGPTDAGGVDDAGLPSDAGDDAGTSPVDAGAPLPPRPDGGWVSRGCAPSSDGGTPFLLRAMAANLTSGNLQSYDPGHGIRIIQGLHPDVVMIQEFNYWIDPNQYPRPPTSEADLAEMMQRTFPDAGYVYARGTQSGIPNGVLSRWPILASGDWADPQVGNRGFTWAWIDLPGPRDLWVVSLHLLTSNANDRNLEATALVKALDAVVPPDDFLLLGGDLNTDKTSEAAFTTLAKRVVSKGAQPVDQQNRPGTNANRDKPYDQVLASKCLAALQVPVQVGTQQFDAGLVFDSRAWTPLSDVDPVLATDSAAANMQHMGVVKDFLVAP